MGKSRYTYSPYSFMHKAGRIKYRYHEKILDLKLAQNYCKVNGLVNITISFESYDSEIVGCWNTENTQIICLLGDGTWEKPDYKALRKNTNF